MANFRALVLDFGQVVAKSTFEIAAHAERGLGLAPGTISWFGPLAPETDPLWAAMLRGELSERDYWARRMAELSLSAGRELDIRTFNEIACESAALDWYRPEIDALVNEARAAGLKIGILTNELELFHGKDFVAQIPILARVDAMVDATHTKILKPDPRAYRAIADALGVRVDEALFVDDQPHNVKGALAVGMSAIHFRLENIPESMAQIRSALDLSDSHEVSYVHS